MEVLGIAEARATLPSIVDQLSGGQLGRVVIGSHRKPQAMILPFDGQDGSTPSPEPLLSRIKARADLVRRVGSLSGVTAVAVFGSVARGEERADSDIDLLVDVAPGTSLFDLGRFEIDMELLFERKIDVVARGGLDHGRKITHEILKDVVVL